jgi:hypothetical protein
VLRSAAHLAIINIYVDWMDASGYISLYPYGIDYEGPMEGVQYLGSELIPAVSEVRVNDISMYEMTVHYDDNSSARRRFRLLPFRTGLDTLKEGGHGDVCEVECYETFRDSNGRVHRRQETLYLKTSKRGESLFCEACFQVAGRQVLRRFGLGDRISRIADILRCGSQCIGFTMEPVVGEGLLSTVLHRNLDQPARFFESIIVGIIAELAALLLLLTGHLGMNHRDLKLNNIVVREADKIMEFVGCGAAVRIWSVWSVYILDFGVACCSGGVSATNLIPPTDPCPKAGRDLFQLLTFLYMSRDVRQKMTARLRGLIEGWLTLPGRNFAQFLREKGDEDGEQWLYYLLTSAKFSAPACEPAAVLARLAAEYPLLVGFSATGSAERSYSNTLR